MSESPLPVTPIDKWGFFSVLAACAAIVAIASMITYASTRPCQRRGSLTIELTEDQLPDFKTGDLACMDIHYVHVK